MRAQAQTQGLVLHLAWATRVICRPARRINHIAHYCSHTLHIRDWVVWGKGVAASRHRRLGVDCRPFTPVRACGRRRTSRCPSAQASIPEQSSPASCKAKVAVTARRPCRPPPPPSSSRLRHADPALDEPSSFTSTCPSSATPSRPLISSVNQPVGRVHHYCSEPTAWLPRALSLVSSNQSTLVLSITPTPAGCDRLRDHLSPLCCLRL